MLGGATDNAVSVQVAHTVRAGQPRLGRRVSRPATTPHGLCATITKPVYSLRCPAACGEVGRPSCWPTC